MRKVLLVLSSLCAVVLATSGCASSGGEVGGGSSVTTTPAHSKQHNGKHKHKHSHKHRNKHKHKHKSHHGGGGGSFGSFVMPNEVGKVLQAAQDDIQRVSHDPVFVSHSQDATGQDRHQFLDSDWKVCSQNVAPGTRVSAVAHIVFSVVKLDESCP